MVNFSKPDEGAGSVFSHFRAARHRARFLAQGMRPHQFGRSNAVLGAAIGDLQHGQLYKVELGRGFGVGFLERSEPE